MKNSKWTKEEENIIRENYLILTAKEIVKKFSLKRSEKSVRRKASELATKKRKRWAEEENKILKENYGKISYKEIGKLLPNRTHSGIKKQAQNLNLTNKENTIMSILGNRIYSYDRDYFSAPNLQNCYWAGLIGADGYVDLNGNRITLGLDVEDINTLKELKKETKFDGVIKTEELQGYNPHTMAKISFCSAHEWMKDLKNNFNIITRKSFTLLPPVLDDTKLIMSYIKGYLDGDGWTTPPERCCKNSYHIGFTGNWQILEWIKKILDENYPICGNRGFSNVRKNHSIFKYEIEGKRAEKILRDIQNIKTPHIPSKWIGL